MKMFKTYGDIVKVLYLQTLYRFMMNLTIILIIVVEKLGRHCVNLQMFRYSLLPVILCF